MARSSPGSRSRRRACPAPRRAVTGQGTSAVASSPTGGELPPSWRRPGEALPGGRPLLTLTPNSKRRWDAAPNSWPAPVRRGNPRSVWEANHTPIRGSGRRLWEAWDQDPQREAGRDSAHTRVCAGLPFGLKKAGGPTRGRRLAFGTGPPAARLGQECIRKFPEEPVAPLSFTRFLLEGIHRVRWS